MDGPAAGENVHKPRRQWRAFPGWFIQLSIDDDRCVRSMSRVTRNFILEAREGGVLAERAVRKRQQEKRCSYKMAAHRARNSARRRGMQYRKGARASSPAAIHEENEVPGRGTTLERAQANHHSNIAAGEDARAPRVAALWSDRSVNADW